MNREERGKGGNHKAGKGGKFSPETLIKTVINDIPNKLRRALDDLSVFQVCFLRLLIMPQICKYGG